MERTDRLGFAGEFSMRPGFSLVAERSLADRDWSTRAGIRFNLTTTLRMDVSAKKTNEEWGGVVGVHHYFSR